MNPTIVPPECGQNISYRVSSTNVAMLVPPVSPDRVVIRGVGNGTATLQAMHGSNVVCASKDIQVVVNVVVTVTTNNISARTAWPGATSPCLVSGETQLELTARVQQAGVDSSTPVDLEINQLLDRIGQPLYSPPNQGTLVRKPGTTHEWIYTSWTESSTYLHARDVVVNFRALIGGVVVATNAAPIKVFSVFNFLAHRKRSYSCAYDFVRWKYATVLNGTGGAFVGAPTFTSASSIPCGSVPEAFACTVDPGIVTFAASTFQSENVAAATIGHELKHTSAAGTAEECEAYTWEYDTRSATGIDSEYNRTFLEVEVIGGRNLNCR